MLGPPRQGCAADPRCSFIPSFPFSVSLGGSHGVVVRPGESPCPGGAGKAHSCALLTGLGGLFSGAFCQETHRPLVLPTLQRRSGTSVGPGG